MIFLRCIVLTSLIIVLAGCSHEESSIENYNNLSDAQKEIICDAIVEFDKNHYKDHTEYNIKLREDENEWIIHFDGKDLSVGNHALVTISKETGQAQYYPGE